MLYRFGEYELDTSLFELRQNGLAQRVEPQVFDVLAYLVLNCTRLVTKDELLEKVWGDTYISEATLNSRLMAARRAIGDNGHDQRLIRTQHGRGYRFVGGLEVVDRPGPPSNLAPALPDEKAATGRIASTVHPSAAGPDELLGRSTEMEALRMRLDAASSGVRQVVFVTGEAGIGKTTLVNAFVQESAAREGITSVHGQCVEFTGQSEPYMPVLEALMRLCRQSSGQEATRILNKVAPTWLIQMPSLVEQDEFALLQQRVVGSTKERMLREAADALDLLAAEQTLILVLEDLHWTDNATLDLLALLARRSEPANLMIIGTYRPQDAQARGSTLHNLVQELNIRGLCHELPVAELADEAISQYVERRLDSPPDSDLVQLLSSRTSGNPLYMGVALDSWNADGLLVRQNGQWKGRDQEEMKRRVPESLRLLIEQRLSSLEPDEQIVLQAASVAGREFSAAAVAATTNIATEVIETMCTRLARRGQFVAEGELHTWTDRSVSQGFSFLHDLYQEVLYSRIPAAQRIRLHQRIGSTLELAYGNDAPERFIELANHFVQGHVPDKASRYLELAAESDIRRSANREAMEHLEQSILQLKLTAPSTERDKREADLLLRRAWGLVTTKGWSEPDAEASYQRALALYQSLGQPHELAESLFGLATMYEVRGEYERCRNLMESRYALTDEAVHADSCESMELLACSLFHQGEFSLSLDYAEKGIAAHDPSYYRWAVASCGDNPGVSCEDWAALALLFLGFPDKALTRAFQAIALAEEPGNMYGLSMARAHVSMIHQLRREVPQAREWAEATVAVSGKYGFVYRVAMGEILLGWATAASGEIERGLKHIQSGLETEALTGAQMDHPYFLGLLADAYYMAGDYNQGMASVEEAVQIVEGKRSFFFEAELHRLRGDLLALSGATGPNIEAAYRTAVEVGQRQHALFAQVRAATSLARCLKEQGKLSDARDTLGPVYQRFTEGFATADLLAAKELLATL